LHACRSTLEDPPGWYVEREIEKMFAFRQKKTKELLEAQSEKLSLTLTP
jgi:hypothetical protein